MREVGPQSGLKPTYCPKCKVEPQHAVHTFNGSYCSDCGTKLVLAPDKEAKQ